MRKCKNCGITVSHESHAYCHSCFVEYKKWMSAAARKIWSYLKPELEPELKTSEWEAYVDGYN